MKRLRENDQADSLNSYIVSPKVTDAVQRDDLLTDLQEDLVARAGILPHLDVRDQLNFATTCVANYNHYSKIILEYSHPNNREYLRSVIQHLAYEPNLLDRLRKLTLRHYPTDSPIVTIVIIICQYLLSDPRNPELLNKLFLLGNTSNRRIELIRFLAPCFLKPEELLSFRNTARWDLLSWGNDFSKHDRLLTQSIADSPEAKEKRESTAIDVLEHGPANFINGFMPKALSPNASKQTKDFLKRILKEQKATAIASALRGMAVREDTSNILANSVLPILIITGDHDTLISPQKSDDMRRLAKNSKLIVIENAGHLSSLDQPEKWNQSVIEIFY